MAFDRIGGSLLLFGGLGGADMLSDLWRWDGASWHQINQGMGPLGRAFATLAEDPVSHNLVLFGGVTATGEVLGDTWTWNGSRWEARNPAVAPPARSAASAAADPVGHGMVLFGGTFGKRVASFLDDTWRWSDDRWISVSPEATPPARCWATMAIHGSSRRLVLLGGTNGVHLADTWFWDGSTWHQPQATFSPSQRYAALGAYDERRHKVVIQGGIGERQDVTGRRYSEPLSDTWSWQGSSWSEHSSLTSPPTGSRGVMAYDPLRGQLVLLTDDGGKGFGQSQTWLA